MKRSAVSAGRSASSSPMTYVAAGRVHETRGTWMMSSGKINGETYDLGRVGDQEGTVLDVLVQSLRNAAAAKRLMRKLMKKLQCAPRVLITDKLTSYGVAHRELMPGVEHCQSTYLNNQAENSPQPTRQRERAMQRFTSPGSAQRFLSEAYGNYGRKGSSRGAATTRLRPPLLAA